MSAEEIYKKLLDSSEDIGLATVYRVLTQFEAAGLVSRHHFEDGMAVFEINHGTHHDHIVCMDCGMVEEFVDPEIESRQNAIAAAPGLQDRRALAGALRPLPAPRLPGRKQGRVKRSLRARLSMSSTASVGRPDPASRAHGRARAP